jgi:carbamoyl-phosphate synthase large subunit
MNLLLLCTGRRVTLIQKLREAAKKLDIPLRIIGTEINPKMPSLYFCDHHYLVNRTFHPQYCSQILEILEVEKIDAILPGSDLDLEFLMTLDLPAHLSSVKLLYSNPDRTGLFLKKTTTAKVFTSLGLEIPKIFSPDDDPPFPCILKEDGGYGSRNQYILEKPEDLTANLPRLAHPFLQQFVEGPEFTVDIFSDGSGKPINILPRLRERVRAGVSDVGIVELSKNLLGVLEDKIESFGLQGPWNLQCILSDNTYYFIEVNPRFSGGIPLTIAAGMDFCQNLLEWALARPITHFTEIRDGLIMMKYEQELFV